jgi:hypothetical protein
MPAAVFTPCEIARRFARMSQQGKLSLHLDHIELADNLPVLDYIVVSLLLFAQVVKEELDA